MCKRCKIRNTIKYMKRELLLHANEDHNCTKQTLATIDRKRDIKENSSQRESRITIRTTTTTARTNSSGTIANEANNIITWYRIIYTHRQIVGMGMCVCVYVCVYFIHFSIPIDKYIGSTLNSKQIYRYKLGSTNVLGPDILYILNRTARTHAQLL